MKLLALEAQGGGKEAMPLLFCYSERVKLSWLLSMAQMFTLSPYAQHNWTHPSRNYQVLLRIRPGQSIAVWFKRKSLHRLTRCHEIDPHRSIVIAVLTKATRHLSNAHHVETSLVCGSLGSSLSILPRRTAASLSSIFPWKRKDSTGKPTGAVSRPESSL